MLEMCTQDERVLKKSRDVVTFYPHTYTFSLKIHLVLITAGQCLPQASSTSSSAQAALIRMSDVMTNLADRVGDGSVAGQATKRAEFYPPVKSVRWQPKKSPCSIGNTSSNGGYSICHELKLLQKIPVNLQY